MAKLPFATGSFDLVYLHAALHHALPRDHSTFKWSNPSNLHDCLTEVARVLKPRKKGGTLFLLGEGIYPDNIKLEDRHYEVAAREQDLVYESWYTIPEYESAYRAAGIYPTVFCFQDHLIQTAYAYDEYGERYNLVTCDDNVGPDNYRDFTIKALQHIPAPVLRRLLPDWISLSSLEAIIGAASRAGDARSGSIAAGHRILAGPFYSAVGQRGQISGVDAFISDGTSAGFLLYGPYVPVSAGRYVALVSLQIKESGQGPLGELETFTRLRAAARS
jgi:hypothetical protein